MNRKNIKKIISDSAVNVETLRAQKEEAERLKRVEERAALLKQQNEHLLLQEEDQDDDITTLSSDDDEVLGSDHQEYGYTRVSDADVIEIPSEDEFLSDEQEVDETGGDCRSRKGPVRKRKSTGPNDNAELVDINNDGAHTDDRFNQPDEEGRVLVNVGHPPDEKPIYLAAQLGKAVKPHQIGGIRFLFDNIVDSLKKHRTSAGLGCILAHSMGLGKTLQLISFIDVYLTHTDAKHVLCIVPINTLQNWMSEFDMWLPSHKTAAFKPNSSEIKFRQFDVFILNDCKTLTTRAKEILEWRKAGGVLLIGYEMYRLLTTEGRTVRGKKVKTKEVESLPTETYENYISDIKSALVDPGPDLVICDEGHRIKNCNAATSLALVNIRTRRRIVLTGYPLQNNLIEYWCMVDFVRPNFLGTKQEFCNMFERPISNGQCADSTPEDKRVMKQRAHVLHKLLRGFVQRRSHSILTKSLPRKHEHVILVRMTPIQKKLMLAFLERIKSDVINAHRLNPIMLFSVFCKVWNHPDILYKIVKEGQNFDDLDIDLGNDKTTKTSKKPGRKKGATVGRPNNKRSAKKSILDSGDEEDLETVAGNGRSNGLLDLDGFQMNFGSDSFEDNFLNPTDGPSSSMPTTPGHYPNRMMDYTWAEPIVAHYKPGMLYNGLKMLLFFEMTEQMIRKGDKLLVFSHSLFTLDIIEKFLSQRKVPKPEKSMETDDDDDDEKWCKGSNYFRIDGSTSASEREKLINAFNKSSHVHLFLLSTRAGCLGINLIGANRIIVFDASWNPCHDAQAACRIYRYGQQKECYIYRLICDESLEKRIYDRQITKQEVSCRVVDELNPETNFTRREIESLIDDLDQINLTEVKEYTQEECEAYDDDIIRYICRNMSQCLSKPPFEHESLLLDRKETKLSQYEKKQAEDIYYKQKEEMSRMSQKHTNYLTSMAANLSNNLTNNFPFSPIVANGSSAPFFANSPILTPAKPTLGRPSKYPSIGMLPTGAIKPGHYPTFFSNGNQPFPFGQLAQSSFQSNNVPFKVPSVNNQNSIIHQYTNLPPAAFTEQLRRLGFKVNAIKSPRKFDFQVSSSSDERVVVNEGEEIIIIVSPDKKVYLRTLDGRLFTLKGDCEKLAAYTGQLSSSPIPSSSSSFLCPSTSTGQPELICLDDDE